MTPSRRHWKEMASRRASLAVFLRKLTAPTQQQKCAAVKSTLLYHIIVFTTRLAGSARILEFETSSIKEVVAARQHGRQEIGDAPSTKHQNPAAFFISTFPASFVATDVISYLLYVRKYHCTYHMTLGCTHSYSSLDGRGGGVGGGRCLQQETTAGRAGAEGVEYPSVHNY